jgi:hypothetical protein
MMEKKRFTVGGRPLALAPADVVAAVRGHDPEPFQKHLVEIAGTVYPPKQVFALVTGWDRASFTTNEAQRVLSRLGFVCRRAGQDERGAPAWVPTTGEDDGGGADRLAAIETALRTAQIAIVGLDARVRALETAAATSSTGPRSSTPSGSPSSTSPTSPPPRSAR